MNEGWEQSTAGFGGGDKGGIEIRWLTHHLPPAFGFVVELTKVAQAAVTAWLCPIGACILAMSLEMEVFMELHVNICVAMLAAARVPSGEAERRR